MTCCTHKRRSWKNSRSEKLVISAWKLQYSHFIMHSFSSVKVKPTWVLAWYMGRHLSIVLQRIRILYWKVGDISSVPSIFGTDSYTALPQVLKRFWEGNLSYSAMHNAIFKCSSFTAWLHNGEVSWPVSFTQYVHHVQSLSSADFSCIIVMIRKRFHVHEKFHQLY